MNPVTTPERLGRRERPAGHRPNPSLAPPQPCRRGQTHLHLAPAHPPTRTQRGMRGRPAPPRLDQGEGEGRVSKITQESQGERPAGNRAGPLPPQDFFHHPPPPPHRRLRQHRHNISSHSQYTLGKRCPQPLVKLGLPPWGPERQGARTHGRSKPHCAVPHQLAQNRPADGGTFARNRLRTGMGPTSFRGFPHRLNTDPIQLGPDWTPHPQTEQASTERHGLGYIPRLPKTLRTTTEASPPTPRPLRPLARAGKATGLRDVPKSSDSSCWPPPRRQRRGWTGHGPAHGR